MIKVLGGLLFASAILAVPAENDLVPKHGRGTPPPGARGNGPWLTRVMLATSTTGLDFRRLHFVLSDQAGVPNVVVGPDGRARVYYIDFGNGNLLACATQQNADNLTNWNYRRVRVSGLPEKQAPAPVDPCVVLVHQQYRATGIGLTNAERQQDAGGTLYRLYFMQAAPLPSCYSAISSNGLDFVKEEGMRFTAKPDPCFDPLALKTKTEWLLWSGGRQTFSAHSSDGVNFTATGDFRVEGARFMPWSAVELPKNSGYRLYGNFVGAGEWSGGISSVFSTDGKSWKREPGIRLSLDGSRYALESSIAPDNGCALLPNGTWLMAYLATIPEARRR
jgi:hypothetical protein